VRRYGLRVVALGYLAVILVGPLAIVFWRTFEDGSRRYLSVSGEPGFDARKRFTGYRGIGRDVTAQQRVVRDALGPSLDDDVEASLPPVVACCERALVVGAQVEGLLLARTGAEVERAVAPHRRYRRDVRMPVCAHCRDPEELGRYEHAEDVLPRRRRGAGRAETGVQIGCRSRR